MVDRICENLAQVPELLPDSAEIDAEMQQFPEYSQTMQQFQHWRGMFHASVAPNSIRVNYLNAVNQRNMQRTWMRHCDIFTFPINSPTSVPTFLTIVHITLMVQ